MKNHGFKKIKELKSKDFKQLTLDLLGDRFTEDYDFYAKMLTVKVAYPDFTNEISIVVIGVCEINENYPIDMYLMPAWPFTLRTDADIRAYDSLVEMYVKDRDELITFKDISA